MIPVRFSPVRAGVFEYHYSTKEFSQWLSRGRSHGDAGPLLVETDEINKIMKFHTFGTIDNPFKEMQVISIKWCGPLDGTWKTPEQRLEPDPKPSWVDVSYTFLMLNL